jgi:PAS domain S-box-containing protein
MSNIHRKKHSAKNTIALCSLSSDITLDNITAKVKELAFNALFKDLPVAFYWMDKDGYFLGCNDVALKNLDLNSLNDFIGKHSDEICTPMAWQGSKQVIETNQTMTLEEIHIKPNGERVYYLSIKSPIRNKSGKAIGLLGISIDITTHKRTEEVENLLSIAFYWMDRNGYFWGANNTELKVLGLSSLNDLIGKHSDEISHPDAWKNSKKVMETNKTMSMEEIHVKSDGEKIYYLSTKSPLYDDSGNAIGLLGASIDITEHKKLAEAELQARKIIEAKNRKASIDLQNVLSRLTQRRYYIPGQSKLYLTQREMACAVCLTRGKSAKEIGKEMGLSYRTIEVYINRSKDKLKCKTKSELIKKLIESGLLDSFLLIPCETIPTKS